MIGRALRHEEQPAPAKRRSLQSTDATLFACERACLAAVRAAKRSVDTLATAGDAILTDVSTITGLLAGEATST
jgi:hypothetical protein